MKKCMLALALAILGVFGCCGDTQNGSFAPDAADAGTRDAQMADASTDREEPRDVARRPQAGDRIKGSGPAVYYLARDGRRYAFPDEQTYRSWYQTFDGIIMITDEQLREIPIGGNVTIRPGTWLVKITTDPKVYSITRCGTLHWLESESVALALYGSNWNAGRGSDIPGIGVRRTQDVPDAFFVNYQVGASIATAVHPDGTIISYAGSSDRFLVQSGMRRLITRDAFELNRFNDAFVVETTISYPMGEPITSYMPELAEPVCIL